ncbi:hypothetical protein AALC75_26870 [Lachnospiraceae bacterium 48-42]
MGVLETVFNSRKFDLNDDVLMEFNNYFDEKSRDYNSFCLDESMLQKESPIPFGGIILAMTWGFSFRIKRSRTRNMERNFYYDIFCS